MLEDPQIAGMVEPLPRLDSLDEDVGRFFERLAGVGKELVISRERLEPDKAPDLAVAKETSAHLVRLWAVGEVAALLRKGKDEDRDRALSLATSYAIVTPVSGAVCLENREQVQGGVAHACRT